VDIDTASEMPDFPILGLHDLSFWETAAQTDSLLTGTDVIELFNASVPGIDSMFFGPRDHDGSFDNL
jgi:hypothetical protein